MRHCIESMLIQCVSDCFGVIDAFWFCVPLQCVLSYVVVCNDLHGSPQSVRIDDLVSCKILCMCDCIESMSVEVFRFVLG